MPNNFEILMDFKELRDFAICASKNNLCCHTTKVENYECHRNDYEEDCRKCWLDFLTDNKGLDLSYLDKAKE